MEKLNRNFQGLIMLQIIIYVGLLVTATGWSRRDYIDIMSYFDCVGFEKITEEEAKDFSVLPTGNYCEFLKLQRAI